MQTTFIAAMPAAVTAQAVAPNSDQACNSDGSAEFAQVLTDCSNESATAATDGCNAKPTGEVSKKENQQEKTNKPEDGGQELQLTAAMACPAGVFAAVAAIVPADAVQGDSGTVQTSSDPAAAIAASTPVSIAPEAQPGGIAAVQAGFEPLTYAAKIQSAAQGEAAAPAKSEQGILMELQPENQTAGGSYEQASVQTGSIQDGVNIGVNLADTQQQREQVPAQVKVQAENNLESAKAPENGNMDNVIIKAEAVSTGRTAGESGNTDASGKGGSPDLNQDEYTAISEKASDLPEFKIVNGNDNRQTFNEPVKIMQEQTDNESVDVNLTVDPSPVRSAPGNAADAIQPQDTQAGQSAFEQVFNRVSEIEIGKDNQITFALKPDSLGSIKIIVEGVGQQMTITIETDNHKVKEALTEGLGQLASSLGVPNVKEDQVKVVLAERQEFVQDGSLSSGNGKGEERRDIFGREFIYEAPQDDEDSKPEQMQVFVRASRFNQYA